MIKTIFEMTAKLGVKNLNTLPGAWQQRIDDNWYIAINGKSEDVAVEPSKSMKANIPPYHICVWYNGWVAGLLHPLEGGEFASGNEANEKNFITAVNEFVGKMVK